MKNTATIISHIFLLFLLIFSSCQKETEWEVKKPGSLLVIEGQVSNEFKKHNVILSETRELYDKGSRIPVSNAIINISDGVNSYPLQELKNQKGKYESVEFFKGFEGKKYTLSIELNEAINGIRYYEAFDVMGKAFSFENAYSYVDQNSFSIGEDSSFLMTTFLYGKQPDTENKYYLANLYKNDSLITDTITKSILINSKEWGTEDEDLVPLIFDYEPEKFVHDSLCFKLLSISKEYFEFLNEVESSNTEPDPLGLSGPLANVKGNFKDALGFFSAVAIEEGKFYVNQAPDNE